MSLNATQRARWLKPAVNTYGPTIVVSVIAEPWDDRLSTSDGHRVLTLQRLHVAESHKRGGEWSWPEYRRFDLASLFWDYLERELPAGRRICVFTPFVMHTLALADWWERLELSGSVHAERDQAAESARAPRGVPGSRFGPRHVAAALDAGEIDGRYHIGSIHESATSAIVRYKCRGRSFLWTNYSQYVTADEEQVAAALHYLPPTPPATEAERRASARDPAGRSILWCRFFARLSNWWVRMDGGPWGASVASCAYSFLKRRIVPRTILQHDDDDAHELENAAIFGGRRQVWYVGNIGDESTWQAHGQFQPQRSPHGTIAGSMVHHDVRSMYPTLLARAPFPVRHLFNKRSPSPAAVADLMERYAVIAAVEIDSDWPEYPVRTPAGVRFPIGRYTTTLCGPELAAAIGRGDVVAVHHAAVYALGRPFSSACEGLLTLRERYRDVGEKAWEIFAKSLAVAMSGKLAQREWTWTPRPLVHPSVKWGSWKLYDWDTKRERRFRVLNGLAWERVEAEVKRRPMGAAYAYLCSYGRYLMSGYRALCPPGSVLAMDTDGIWTTTAAVPFLYGDRDQESRSSGDLNVTVTAPCGRFFGAQHYWWGRAWVLAGSGSPDVQPDTNVATVTETSSPWASYSTTPPAAVHERRVERDIGRISAGGVIGADGWVTPIVLPAAAGSGPQRQPDETRWKG